MSDRERALSLALQACLSFLVTEAGWEEFRVEMLYFDDEPKKTVSKENARKLRNFLSHSSILPFVKELESAR